MANGIKKKNYSNNETTEEICTVVAFSPDGTIIASGFDSGTIRLWNVQTKKELLILQGHKDKITSLVFSPNCQLLFSAAADKRIVIWEAFKGDLLKTLRGHRGAINSLAINQDGSLLASASSDKRIRLWSREKSWRKMVDLKGHNDTISEVQFSPDGSFLASVSWDHSIILWDIPSQKQKHCLVGHFGPIYALAFHPDGKRLATCSSDGTIKLWDALTGKAIETLTASKTTFTTIDFHPNKELLASGASNNLITLWDLKTKSAIKKLKKHKEAITDLKFSPNGKILSTTSKDGNIQLWQVNDLLKTPPPSLLTRAKEMLLGGKRLVENLWDSSVQKIKEIQETSQEIQQQARIRQKMMTELPKLFSLMPDDEVVTLLSLQEKYNCSEDTAEKVIIDLIRANKIRGTFNPFIGVFTVQKDGKSVVLSEVSDSTEELVELDQTCFYCGTPLSSEVKYCPHCNEEVAICPVCKLSIDFDDEVGVCIFCGTKGHLSHMKEAAKVTGKCPVCQKQLAWDTEITVFQRKTEK
jgi:hypothetical protein